MPKKDPNEDRKQTEHRAREHKRGHEHERGGGDNGPEGSGDSEHPRRRRMGREHAVHEQINDRRLGGGAPATPDAYAKALEQWHKLPGSVVRPPSDEKPATKTPPPSTDKDDKENKS